MTNKLAAAVILALAAAPVLACENLTLEEARVMEAPPGADVLAAYATLRNGGDKSLTITAVDSPDFASGDFHKMSMADGMMHMEKMDRVTIAPHGSLTLKTGENHLMLMGPKRSLKRGDEVHITMHCGKDAKTFTFPVQAPSTP